MTVVNIKNHGRITIPSEIRKKYGWKNYQLSRKLKPLKEWGFIVKNHYALWEITNDGIDYLERNRDKISIGNKGVQRHFDRARQEQPLSRPLRRARGW